MPCHFFVILSVQVQAVVQRRRRRLSGQAVRPSLSSGASRLTVLAPSGYSSSDFAIQSLGSSRCQLLFSAVRFNLASILVHLVVILTSSGSGLYRNRQAGWARQTVVVRRHRRAVRSVVRRRHRQLSSFCQDRVRPGRAQPSSDQALLPASVFVVAFLPAVPCCCARQAHRLRPLSSSSIRASWAGLHHRLSSSSDSSSDSSVPSSYRPYRTDIIVVIVVHLTVV